MVADDEHSPVTALLVWQTYRIPIILGGCSLLFIVLSITIFIKSYQATQPITFSSDTVSGASNGEATGSADAMIITIDVEGAVVHPGLYHLPPGSRVEDAIAAAGGFGNNADSDMVAKTLNRAAKISDGSKLYIPATGESASAASGGIAAGATQGSATVPSAVSINTASQSQLDSLSGVGPVTAGKIIAGRPYLRLEELVEKKAMSASLFTKLKDQLTL